MILLIDNYDSFTYNLYQLLAALDEVVVKRNDALTLAQIEVLAPSHVVISPGPGVPENAGMSKAIIQFCDAHNIPLLGICLGHQAIVEVYGGVVEVAPHPVHGKSADIYHDKTELYEGMAMPFQAGRYHSLYALAEKIPSSLIVDAQTKDGIVMGIRHESKPIYGFQFHPESILTPKGVRLIKNFLDL